jgi:hypothetical protein
VSTSEGLSTGRSGDSRSHQWRLVVDGNVAYHLTHNAGKSLKIQEKVRALGFELWWVASHRTVLPRIHLQQTKHLPCEERGEVKMNHLSPAMHLTKRKVGAVGEQRGAGEWARARRGGAGASAAGSERCVRGATSAGRRARGRR